MKQIARQNNLNKHLIRKENLNIILSQNKAVTRFTQCMAAVCFSIHRLWSHSHLGLDRRCCGNSKGIYRMVSFSIMLNDS